MWNPDTETDPENADRLCERLDNDVKKIDEAYEKAKKTRNVHDAMCFNDIYLGIDDQVRRINSERRRFTRKERWRLEESVLRARKALKNHRVMIDDDITENKVSVGTVLGSVPDSSDEDDDGPPSLVSTIPSGDEGEDDDVGERDGVCKKPFTPEPTAVHGGGDKTTPEKPHSLRSCEPAAAREIDGSSTRSPGITETHLPNSPTTANDDECLPNLQLLSLNENEQLEGACAAPDPSPNLPEDPPDKDSPATSHSGEYLDGSRGEGSESIDSHEGSDADADMGLTSDIMRIVMHSQAMETLRATRPPPGRRFSGNNDDVDIEAHLRTFDLITDHLNVSDALKYAELPNWFAGTALDICRRYDEEKDLSSALKRIKQHLIMEFSQTRIPLTLSLDKLLMGDQIDRLDTDEFLNLIIKLENLQQKAADRGKPDALGSWAIEHVLAKRLDFAVEPWIMEKAKNWADKALDSDEDLAVDIDEEIPFNDFLLFLRRLQRRSHYEKRYYETKAVVKKDEPAPSVTKNKVEGPKKKKPTKTSPSAGWSCPFCLQTCSFHHATDCMAFMTKSRADKIKAIRKLNRCLNCFKPNHIAKDCTRPRCDRCKETHHTSLHPGPEEREPGNGF